MTRLPVVFRPAAADDLEAIFHHVFDQSGDRGVARGYAARIGRRCAMIGDAPFAGIARPDLGDGIRLTVFERRAVILYRVHEDRVEITNIFGAGRDYETLLRGR